MIKAFITDVDGTLFDHGQMIIPPKNIEAIAALQAKGVIIVIATARTYASSQSIVEALNMKKYGGYLIASNGATIYDVKSDKLIYQRPMPMAVVKELYTYSCQNNLHFSVEQDDYVVTSGYDQGIIINSQIVGVDFIWPSHLNDFFKYIKTEPLKVSFTQEEPIITKYYPIVNDYFANRLYISHAGSNYIDIVLKDVNKKSAVEYLLTELGYDFAEVAAIGDGDNDSWLLAHAGSSAAVANGTEKAKAAGKVMVSDCGSAGLSDFVEQLLR